MTLEVEISSQIKRTREASRRIALAPAEHKNRPLGAIADNLSRCREVIQLLKRSPELVDLIIPRGGKSLKSALAGSEVPVLPHFDGICHTYVDIAGDLKMAEEICFNAKCSRPSVCNAMETMLVHAGIAEKFLPAMAARFMSAGVELRGDERACAIFPAAKAATETDWDTEYLDLIRAV